MEREMPQGFFDETKATARLPNLDIEIVRSRSPAGDAERITISLQAAPSFPAFGRFLEATNPFLFWMRRSFRQKISIAFPRRRKPVGLIQLRGFSFAAVQGRDAREKNRFPDAGG
jgi:hypothetical protein